MISDRLYNTIVTAPLLSLRDAGSIHCYRHYATSSVTCAVRQSFLQRVIVLGRVTLALR